MLPALPELHDLFQICQSVNGPTPLNPAPGMERAIITDILSPKSCFTTILTYISPDCMGSFACRATDDVIFIIKLKPLEVLATFY